MISERLEDVKTLGSKHFCTYRVANERGGQRGGGSKAQSTTSAAPECKGSKNIQTSRDTCDTGSPPENGGKMAEM